MNIMRDVTLSDKYALECGQVYMTGTQALVRLPMLQRQRDLKAGLNTACFISGYRGSPLGNLDRELWSAKKFIDKQHIKFEAGINEEAKPKIVVVENGDHAVTWRLLYYVKNPYRMLDARNTVQTIAFELSQQEKVGLNTPVTHQILSGIVSS